MPKWNGKIAELCRQAQTTYRQKKSTGVALGSTPESIKAEEILDEVAEMIAKAMQQKTGYNFRNARPYWTGFVGRVKLYYCDDRATSKYDEQLRQDISDALPEDVESWYGDVIGRLVIRRLRNGD